MIKLRRCSAETHQGPFLQLNEDGYDFDIEKNLYMVLDGFGGSGIGDKCIDSVKETMKSFYGRVSNDPDSTLPFFFSSKYVLEGNALVNALLYTHKNIYQGNMSKEVNQRAGAAGIFVAISEEILALSSIGNVMAYLYRNGHLTPLFIPDNFELMSTDENFERHFKSAPMSGLGLFKELHFQMKEVKVRKGDSVILMTDGVYTRVQQNEILHSLSTIESSKQRINTLFNLSNSRGNLDNQTMMILDF